MKNQLMNAYAQNIYELVSTHGRQRGSIILNLANENHYRCISNMFGGENCFREMFPLHYDAAQQAIGLANTISDQQGFLDITKVQNSHYDKKDGNLYSCGYSNLTGLADTVYQTLFIYKDGELKGSKSSFEFNTNFAGIHHSAAGIVTDTGGEVTIVIHSSWKSKKTNQIMSAINYEKKDVRTFMLGDVVSNIVLDDPVHKKTDPASGIITVSYGRKSSTEKLDYEYSEVRLEKLQKVFLDNSGTVTLLDGVQFVSGEPKQTGIVLNHTQLGTIWYMKDIPANAFTKHGNNQFKWSFDMDWDNTIPSSVSAGTRPYAFDMELAFYAIAPNQSTPSLYTITVSSYPNPNPPTPDYKQISNIKLMWGCLAKGSQVRMADGSQQFIELIRAGDKIMGANKRSLVVRDTISGSDSDLLCVVTDGGQTIVATETHPFMTDEGIKPLFDLFIGDKLLMENGNYSLVAECYPLPKASVFNLDTEDDEMFICNGFVVGGFASQNVESNLFTTSSADTELIAEGKKWQDLCSCL